MKLCIIIIFVSHLHNFLYLIVAAAPNHTQVHQSNSKKVLYYFEFLLSMFSADDGN
jgi:hypothetical protein